MCFEHHVYLSHIWLYSPAAPLIFSLPLSHAICPFPSNFLLWWTAGKWHKIEFCLFFLSLFLHLLWCFGCVIGSNAITVRQLPWPAQTTVYYNRALVFMHKDSGALFAQSAASRKPQERMRKPIVEQMYSLSVNVYEHSSPVPIPLSPVLMFSFV